MCDKAHKGSKASRDHELLLWSKLPVIPKTKTPAVPSLLCEMHTTMVINTFCVEHDEVICENCKTTTHRNCNTVTIQDQRGKTEEGFSKTMKQLVRLKYRYEDSKEMRHADKDTLRRKVEKCLNDMRSIRHEVNSALDKIESGLIAEIKEYEGKISKEIAGHLNIADDMLVQISKQVKEMKKFQKSRDDDIIFVGMKKTAQQVREYKKAIVEIHKEINLIDINFRSSEAVPDIIQQLQSIGTILVPNSPYKQGQSSLLSIAIVDKQPIDVRARDVRGCTFMPDGHFVLACFTDGVKIFDKSFRFKNELYVPSADIAAFGENSVVVTQRNLKQLQLLQVLPTMAVERKIRIERICCGVDVYGEEIYVTCHDNPGNGEVQVLNKSGKIQRRLGVLNEKYMFTRPLAVKLSRDGNKVFVSDSDTNTVTCLSQHGHVIYRYNDPDLIKPTGLCVDAVDNILVCSWRSNTVHVVGKDGKKQRVVLTEADGINNPLCVSYRQSIGSLVVGLDNRANTALIVVQTQ